MASAKKDWIALIRGIATYTNQNHLDIKLVRVALIEAYPETNFQDFDELFFVDLIAEALTQNASKTFFTNAFRFTEGNEHYINVRVKHAEQQACWMAVERLIQRIDKYEVVAHQLLREGAYFVIQLTFKINKDTGTLFFTNMLRAITLTLNKQTRAWTRWNKPDFKVAQFHYPFSEKMTKAQLDDLKEKNKDLLFTVDDVANPTKYHATFALSPTNEKIMNEIFNQKPVDAFKKEDMQFISSKIKVAENAIEGL